jgi:hypothetical protein
LLAVGEVQRARTGKRRGKLLARKNKTHDSVAYIYTRADRVPPPRQQPPPASLPKGFLSGRWRRYVHRLLRRHLSGNFTEARLHEPLMQQLRRLGCGDRRAVIKALNRGRWCAAQQVSLLLRLHAPRDNIDA